MKNKNPNVFSTRSRVSSVMAVCAVFIAFAGNAAQASSGSWNVNATGTWSTAGNWDTNPNPAPGSTTIDNTDIATFSLTLTAARTVTVDANRFIGGISFGNTSAFGYTLGTGILHLNNTGVIQTLATDGAHADTITSAIVLDGVGGTATFTAGSSTGTLSITTGGITGVSTGGNTTTLTLNGTSTSLNTVSAVIGDGSAGGNMAIVKNDAGTWTISGANTFSGGTTLNNGTLNINNKSALGSGAFVINGGTINNNSAGGISLLSTTSYVAGTSASGATTVLLSNTSGLQVGQYVFGTNVGNGAYITAITANTSITLSAANSGAVTGNTLTFGALNTQAWNSDFAYTGTQALNLGSGAVSLGTGSGTARTITVNGSTLTEGGIISNGTTVNSLIKAGAGALTLTGSNAYTGSLTVTGGTLSILNAQAYSGVTSILNGTLVASNLNALGTGNTTSVLLGDTTGSANTKLSNGISNGGTISRNVIVQAGNTGTATIAGSASSVTSTMSGTITLGSSVSGTMTGHGLSLTNNSNAALTISGKITDPSVGATTTPGLLTIAGPSGTTGTAGQIFITNTTNDYAGGTLISSGRLGLGNGASLGTGTLVVNVGTITGGNSGGGFTQNATGSLTTNNVMVWDSDFIYDISGTPGNISLNLGTGSVTLGDGNQSTPTTAGTRTLYVNNSTLIVGGAIADSTSGTTVNGLTKAGGGVLQLGGASTYSGTTTVAAGKLQLTTGNDRLPTGTTLTVGSGTASATAAGGLFDLNTRNQTVGGLSGGSGTGFQGIITNGGATTSTLTVNNTANTEYDGLLVKGGTGSLSLVKSGAGSLTLGGSSNYTGGTSVTGGTLVITGGLSSSAGGATTGTYSVAGTTINVGSATGLAVGETVSGTGVPAGTVVTAINNPGTGTITVTVSNFLTSAGSGSTVTFGSYAGSALGSGPVSVGANATLAGTGAYSGSSFSIQGTDTSNRANVLVGKVSTSDTNTASSLVLKATGASTISNANLSFNLNVSTPGALGSNPSGSGTELSVGNTAITFGGGTGSVLFTLNMQNEPGVVAGYTPYVLIAGTLATGGTGTNGSQYSGLTLGTITTLASGVTESIITGNNLQLAFGSALDTSFYGANSYLVLYQDTNNGIDDIDVVVVPEPGTWAMMIGGLAVLIFWQRRKGKQN